MDTVLGISYDGGGKIRLTLLEVDFVRRCVSLTAFFDVPSLVLIAADQSNSRSILTYQKNLDKIKKLSSHSMMGVSGPNCDLVNFTE
jgi:hypothetical protein